LLRVKPRYLALSQAEHTHLQRRLHVVRKVHRAKRILLTRAATLQEFLPVSNEILSMLDGKTLGLLLGAMSRDKHNFLIFDRECTFPSADYRDSLC
jgi:hypothetical protein